ncbi:ATP-dependent zinc metalloprotease FTSH 10, mitochondrial-like isoform X2 [Corylus avellana]|uniref:ATP-dependent zinc metalloprotease FTSH 10, mitochondrial-like isoform X2 n=1 Tax=Corylus avellana TaxID=13451 RepID=UPI00286C9E27|nr:ATP-dependent zinc metalloprotease FTSH 10, mitochondrial-like isoform X2 [Corylus avellana]
MIFSRIGRSLSRSNVISSNYAERAVLASESLLPSTGNACFSRADGGLGLVRGYVTSVGAGKQLVANSHLSNFSSVLAYPRVWRFLSSQAPKKKNYENYYPKDKKEIPKANEQKSESKGNKQTRVAYCCLP